MSPGHITKANWNTLALLLAACLIWPAALQAQDAPGEDPPTAELQLKLRNPASLFGSNGLWLVEGAHPETEHLLVGRHRGQAPDVDSQVLINEGDALPGRFHPVEITETAGYDVVGRIVGGGC